MAGGHPVEAGRQAWSKTLLYGSGYLFNIRVATTFFASRMTRALTCWPIAHQSDRGPSSRPGSHFGLFLSPTGRPHPVTTAPPSVVREAARVVVLFKREIGSP